MKKHLDTVPLHPAPKALFVVFVMALALLFGGCSPGMRKLPQPTGPPTEKGTSSTQKDTSSTSKTADLSQKDTSSDEKGTKPGIFSGIGKLFSTPEGSARRQARKDAAATVPRKLGKGAVYAPAATEVVNAYKPKGSTTAKADSGAVVTNAPVTKNKGALAVGPGATATNTVEKKPFPWLLVLLLAGGAYYTYRRYLS